MSGKNGGPARKGEAGVLRGSEPGDDTTDSFLQQGRSASKSGAEGDHPDLDLFGYFSSQHNPTARGGQQHDVNSGAAGDLIATLGPSQRLTFEFISARGSFGATNDECATGLGVDCRFIRSRLTQLRRKGLIADVGGRRSNKSGRQVIVWQAHPICSQVGEDEPERPVAARRSMADDGRTRLEQTSSHRPQTLEGSSFDLSAPQFDFG